MLFVRADNTLQFINGSYALVVPIKSSASQVSITIQISLINPTPNVYVFNGSFFSDGILFASTNSPSVTIFSNAYTQGIISQANLLNLPRGAGT
jgi:hypothetical protein